MMHVSDYNDKPATMDVQPVLVMNLFSSRVPPRTRDAHECMPTRTILERTPHRLRPSLANRPDPVFVMEMPPVEKGGVPPRVVRTMDWQEKVVPYDKILWAVGAVAADKEVHNARTLHLALGEELNHSPLQQPKSVFDFSHFDHTIKHVLHRNPVKKA